MSASDRVLGPSGDRRRRRLLIVSLVALAAALIIAAAQATPPEQNPPGYFELDKNLINNEQTPSFGASNKTLGVLGGNINASVQSFTVCQNTSTNPTTSTLNPITIQVEAERMTVGAIANASGGGCPQGTSKRTYSSVTRGALGTTAASHGASGVQGYVTQVIGPVNNTVTGDDWDQVKSAVDFNNAPGPPAPLDNPCSGAGWNGNADAVACDWIHDEPNQTVFTTGGSKDDQDIPNWRYTNSSVPDSDDITDGYAIKYQKGAQQFLYFGADRVAVNGSKDMGFWFFKKEVSPDPESDQFIGEHTVGDILLLGTFTNGGASTTIRVFKWVGPGNGDTNGVLDSSGGTFGDCVPGGQTDGCNTVNNGTIKSPWAYQSKISNTPADTIFAGGAMEGGIDLTSLGLTGCFSTFMAETRASPTVDATLKDFLIGKFESCGSSLTTTPKDGNGNPIPAGPPAGLSIGTGIVNAKDSADLQVTGTDTWSGTFKFFLCGPIPTADTCDGTDHVGVQIGSTVNLNVTPGNPFSGPIVSNAARLTSAANGTTGAPGHYCWRGEFTSATVGVDSQTDATQGECFNVNPVTPTLVTTAVQSLSLLSPRIFSGLADLNGDGNAGTGIDSTPDNSQVFYGDTSIIGGKLDCDDWKNQSPPENAGTAGDGTIDGDDDCKLVGVDGSADGVEIGVVDGSFATIDGDPIPNGTRLPTKFKFPAVTSSTVADADFAWSALLGRVDANGSGGITDQDCSVDVVNTIDVLGEECQGFSMPDALNGRVDVNSDGQITAADSCTAGCFLGHDVTNGFVVAGTVPFGEPVYDVATLSGTATQPGTNGPSLEFPSIYQASGLPNPNGAAAAGSIEFTLLGPGASDCSTIAAQKSGTLGSNPETVTVTGNGDYQTNGFTTASPGVFHWKAVYSGNNPNTLGTDHNTACNQTGEDVTVQQVTPLLSTKQFVYPQDKAKITCSPTTDCSSSSSGNLNGNVRFRLFNTAANCTAHGDEETVGTNGLLYISNPISVSGPAPQTVGHPAQTSAAVIAGSTVAWRVTYTSSVGAQTNASPSACTEQTTVSFAGDDSSITVP